MFMKVVSITMNTYQVVSENEILPSLLASDSHRGGVLRGVSETDKYTMRCRWKKKSARR